MDDLYSSKTALFYIFNLIVGAGSLTLPRAFYDAGWVLSSVLIVVLALFSYITVTFVIESIALCSSIIQWRMVERMKKVTREIRSAAEGEMASEDEMEINEDALMLPQEYIDFFPSEPQRLFSLDNKVELGEMALLLFNKLGLTLFYIFLCLYLYGDLTIYSAVISKTIVTTVCTSDNLNSTLSDYCWTSYDFKRGAVYKMALSGVLFILGPFVFFNIQKTKYLQFLTIFSRLLAFVLMIGLCIKRLANPNVEHGQPPQYNFEGFPALLGSCVYSFMCHHSLPGLIVPIMNKSKLKRWIALDYIAILILYLTLALVAVFAFNKIEDLFTLNFPPDTLKPNLTKDLISYFLMLFPVFTFSTTFPIVSVTLRSNLQAMFIFWQYKYIHTLIIPVITVVPPVLLAMTTDKIENHVGITGSFAGIVVQYIIPAGLVILARQQIPPLLKNVSNPHSSPFKTIFWPILVLTWAVICIAFAIINITLHKHIE
ncbi:transmembrane protein 104 homolog [Cimex lectularius]|uniref:Amino acid transporter transmembrane domain-containing protein n=1 Tax=Cimex lectularius TaxID=79782 RepID=A0A8I6SAF2_CIMLE|nr:transmembrane protein 104 homolog [Cimex lectularius]